MQMEEIVRFWSAQRKNRSGSWVHPDDDNMFESVRHTFNLDFPVSPYVGNVLEAPVIILGANARYNPSTTPVEFPDEEAVERYVNRVCDPAQGDWSPQLRQFTP